MNFLAQLGSIITGAGNLQTEAQQAADSATQAFYVIAGELAIVIFILFVIAFLVRK
jgi:hypothetical protein